MPTTTWGNRYPSSSAAPNVNQDIQNLANDVQTTILPRFASIAARNAAITTPVANQACVVNGDVHTYDGGAWRWRRTGFGSVTTDAGGNIVFAHGLGATPTGVLVTSGPQATDLLNRVVSINYTNADATNVSLYVKRTDTSAALASNLITFAWMAFV